MEPSERNMSSAMGAHRSWANTADRPARTAPARAALERRFLTEAGGDPVRAGHLRTAHYLSLALASAVGRRKAREAAQAATDATQAAEDAENDLRSLGEIE